MCIRDRFLIRIHYKPDSTSKKNNKQILLEIPNREGLLNIFEISSLEKILLKRKALEIEGNDNFHNSALNILPNSNKQGILEFFVDDLFTDWETRLVCLSPGLLFMLPLKHFVIYNKKNSIINQGIFFRLVSYNLIQDLEIRGIKKKNTFLLKVLNEDDAFIFNAFSQQEREDWLKIF